MKLLQMDFSAEITVKQVVLELADNRFFKKTARFHDRIKSQNLQTFESMYTNQVKVGKEKTFHGNSIIIINNNGNTGVKHRRVLVLSSLLVALTSANSCARQLYDYLPG